MNEFINRLQGELKRNNMDQKELADKTGITPATISRYMTGKMKPSAENAKILANTLGISIDYLLGNSNIRRTDDPNGEEDIVTIAAHHDGEEFTEEEKKMIEDFKDMVRKMKQKKGQ